MILNNLGGRGINTTNVSLESMSLKNLRDFLSKEEEKTYKEIRHKESSISSSVSSSEKAFLEYEKEKLEMSRNFISKLWKESLNLIEIEEGVSKLEGENSELEKRISELEKRISKLKEIQQGLQIVSEREKEYLEAEILKIENSIQDAKDNINSNNKSISKLKENFEKRKKELYNIVQDYITYGNIPNYLGTSEIIDDHKSTVSSIIGDSSISSKIKSESATNVTSNNPNTPPDNPNTPPDNPNTPPDNPNIYRGINLDNLDYLKRNQSNKKFVISVADVKNTINKKGDEFAQEQVFCELQDAGFLKRIGLFFTKNYKHKKYYNQEVSKYSENFSGENSDAVRKIAEKTKIDNVEASHTINISGNNIFRGNIRDYVEGRITKEEFLSIYREFLRTEIAKFDEKPSMKNPDSDVLKFLDVYKEIQNMTWDDFSNKLKNSSKVDYNYIVGTVFGTTEITLEEMKREFENSKTNFLNSNLEIQIFADKKTDVSAAYEIQNQKRNLSYKIGKQMSKHPILASLLTSASVGATAFMGLPLVTRITGMFGFGGLSGFKRYSEVTDRYEDYENRVTAGKHKKSEIYEKVRNLRKSYEQATGFKKKYLGFALSRAEKELKLYDMEKVWGKFKNNNDKKSFLDSSSNLKNINLDLDEERKKIKTSLGREMSEKEIEEMLKFLPSLGFIDNLKNLDSRFDRYSELLGEKNNYVLEHDKSVRKMEKDGNTHNAFITTESFFRNFEKILEKKEYSTPNADRIINAAKKDNSIFWLTEALVRIDYKKEIGRNFLKSRKEEDREKDMEKLYYYINEVSKIYEINLEDIRNSNFYKEKKLFLERKIIDAQKRFSKDRFKTSAKQGAITASIYGASGTILEMLSKSPLFTENVEISPEVKAQTISEVVKKPGTPEFSQELKGVFEAKMGDKFSSFEKYFFKNTTSENFWQIVADYSSEKEATNIKNDILLKVVNNEDLINGAIDNGVIEAFNDGRINKTLVRLSKWGYDIHGNFGKGEISKILESLQTDVNAAKDLTEPQQRIISEILFDYVHNDGKVGMNSPLVKVFFDQEVIKETVTKTIPGTPAKFETREMAPWLSYLGLPFLKNNRLSALKGTKKPKKSFFQSLKNMFSFGKKRNKKIKNDSN